MPCFRGAREVNPRACLVSVARTAGKRFAVVREKYAASSVGVTSLRKTACDGANGFPRFPVARRGGFAELQKVLLYYYAGPTKRKRGGRDMRRAYR